MQSSGLQGPIEPLPPFPAHGYSRSFRAVPEPPQREPGAIYATLNSEALTEAAKAFTSGLIDGLQVHEQKTGSRTNKRHGQKLLEFQKTVEAFVGDLLIAAGNDAARGWLYRSMKRDSFTGEHVSFRSFSQILKCFEELQLVEKRPGEARLKRCGISGDYIPGASSATRFKATMLLVCRADRAGIDLEEAKAHFALRLPKRTIALRRANTKHNGQKVDGPPMAFDPHQVEHLERDLGRLNAFLDTFSLEGGTHRGYVRKFNEGDHPEFRWNKGGRLYSQGSGCYQRDKKTSRVQMRLDGSPVVEVDIRASYLTILHGLLGERFDTTQDPYEVEGLEPRDLRCRRLQRWVLKAWTVATLGHDKFHTRWPSNVIEDFREETRAALGEPLSLGKVYSIRDVQRAMTNKHPALSGWGELGLSWADLMFVESEAVIATMLGLMDEHQIPSLAVHDSLIVRADDLDLACEALRKSYQVRCGLVPDLKALDSNGVEWRP